MAFFSKAGNILRQISQKQINHEIAASKPSILQTIRCMSSSKVFVGGLSYSTDDTRLREAFSSYGDVAEARVIQDRETGRSRGFGFVTYASDEAASSAIQALDGQELDGRRVRVNYANDRPRSFGGGGGYGDGQYGGNTYGQGGGGYGGNTYGQQGGGGQYGGNTYGQGGGGYGGNTYGQQGGGGGYGGNTYGQQGGGNTYNAQGNGYNAVGDLSGGNNYANPAAVPSYGGYEAANIGPGVGLDEQLGNGNGGEEPAGGEFRDDDDVSGDFANRRG